MVEVAERIQTDQIQTILVEKGVIESLSGIRNLMEIVQRTCGEERNLFVVNMVLEELPKRHREALARTFWEILEGLQEERDIAITINSPS